MRNTAQGWIKLHRKLLDCALFDGNEPSDRKSAWIDLLLLANHNDKKVIFNGQPTIVKAGQRITSIRKLAAMWNWSKDRTERFLDLLESEGMITRESDNHRTVLTIVNYEFYQGQCDTDKDTDKDTHKDTHKDTDKPQTRIKKNDKEEKNIYGEFHHVRLTDRELERLKTDLGESMTDECIKFLDEYMEEKPKYKSESHNLAIRRWVVDAVKKRKEQNKPKGNFNKMVSESDNYSDFIKQMEGK